MSAELADLAARMGRVVPRLPRCTVYRIYGWQAWLTWRAHPLDGTWRGAKGVRYNAPGGRPTVYSSLSRIGAMAEYDQRAMLFGLPTTPGGVDVIEIHLLDVPVLDLTDKGVRRRLGVSLDELRQPSSSWEDWKPGDPVPLTHAIGGVARRHFCGVLAPSWIETQVRALQPLHNAVLFLAVSDPWQPR